LLILKIIKIFKKCYHSVVVMWQHMSSVPVMRTVWRRELDSTVVTHTQICNIEDCKPVPYIDASCVGRSCILANT
jgi:hypothetical protein